MFLGTFDQILDLGYAGEHLTMELFPSHQISNAFKYLKIYYYDMLATTGYFSAFVSWGFMYSTAHIEKSEGIFTGSVLPSHNMDPGDQTQQAASALTH